MPQHQILMLTFFTGPNWIGDPEGSRSIGPIWAHCGSRQCSKHPKITKNGALHLRDGRRRGTVSPFIDTIHLGNVWAAFSSRHFCPQTVSVGPIWARLRIVPHGPKPKILSQARWTKSRFRGHFFPMPTPLLLVSSPQDGPNTPLHAVLPVWPRFGVFWPVHAHGKVQNAFPQK